MSMYGDWRICMRQTGVLGIGLASSVSLSGSSEPDLALVSGGSSKMSAILGFHSHDETAMLVCKTMAN